MEQYFIGLSIRERVAAEPNALTRALTHAQQGKASLWLLGTRGSCTCLTGDQVQRKATNVQYMLAAKAGLLYVEYPDHALKAFSSQIDARTGMPVLLEKYEVAFAKRMHEGPAVLDKQNKLSLQDEQ